MSPTATHILPFTEILLIKLLNPKIADDTVDQLIPSNEFISKVVFVVVFLPPAIHIDPLLATQYMIDVGVNPLQSYQLIPSEEYANEICPDNPIFCPVATHSTPFQTTVKTALFILLPT